MEFSKKVAAIIKPKKPCSGINASFPKKSPEENRMYLRKLLEDSIMSFIAGERVLVHSCEVTDMDDTNGIPRINVHIKYTPLEVSGVSYSQYRYDTYEKDDSGNERLVRRGDRNYNELGDLMCKVDGEMVEERFDIIAKGPRNSMGGKHVAYDIKRAESSKD